MSPCVFACTSQACGYACYVYVYVKWLDCQETAIITCDVGFKCEKLNYDVQYAAHRIYVCDCFKVAAVFLLAASLANKLWQHPSALYTLLSPVGNGSLQLCSAVLKCMCG